LFINRSSIRRCFPLFCETGGNAQVGLEDGMKNMGNAEYRTIPQGSTKAFINRHGNEQDR
jgi:hypothetical protein